MIFSMRPGSSFRCFPQPRAAGWRASRPRRRRGRTLPGPQFRKVGEYRRKASPSAHGIRRRARASGRGWPDAGSPRASGGRRVGENHARAAGRRSGRAVRLENRRAEGRARPPRRTAGSPASSACARRVRIEAERGIEETRLPQGADEARLPGGNAACNAQYRHGTRGKPQGALTCGMIGSTSGACGASGTGRISTTSSSSSFGCTGSPAGLMRRAETKMTRLRLRCCSTLERKSRPMSGMSPRSGILSSIFCTSSRMRPPSTTVLPSNTLTLVCTLRVEKIGWLMMFGVRMFVVEMPVSGLVEVV